ncbi:hypothetical protein, conserved [Leishmania tarentolae]|uniref:Histone chaperone RTT106/FACT complex subunit SPT16-like middle domain-containing protein n=1 Tax=Leishmania tarentolae TaxID=5689 RepID=A0A640KNN8_LEITA|nr:hypothetical protein, conserved [Leishmania tarentolae]
MSIPLENWGQLKLSVETSELKAEGDADMKKGECTLELLALPKGKAKDNPNYVPHPILSIPISAIASASGTTKNDVSLTMRPTATAGAGDVELRAIRFAVPNVCVGYEETEMAGKVILQDIQNRMMQYQEQFLQRHGNGGQDGKLLALAAMGSGQAKHTDEVVVATFDDVLLSYPSGKYKIVISNYNVVLEDKRKGTSSGLLSFPLSDIQNLFLCDVPVYFSATEEVDANSLPQYVVLILKNPLKIRTTTYNHVVISCPVGLSLDEEHPWRCELKTQEEIDKTLHLPPRKEGEEPPLVPTMSGRVSDIFTRTFKAIAKVPAYGGINKEYKSVLTGHSQSSMRCLFHGAEGLLYIVNSGFLYLHRPATRILFSDVTRVELDESESGQATFQLTVFTAGAKGDDKYIFSGIAKEEKDGILGYLGTKVKVLHTGGGATESDDDEEDDASDEDDDSDDSDDEDSAAEDDEDDSGDDNGDYESSRKRKREDKKHRKHKKDKKHKKEKKHKKHRKHKREKDVKSDA